jgi:hypothetical protein
MKGKFNKPCIATKLLVTNKNTKNKIELFTVDSKPYGKTYGEWTVNWWQWALSIPSSINPVVDKTGLCASVNQPVADVWFLAGKFGTEDKYLPERKCTVPFSRAILFPIINCEANPLEYPQLKTKLDIIDHVLKDEDNIVRKECYVNGEQVTIERIQSDPPVFPITINEDNALGLEGGGSTMAAADGYWVFLKPLPKGEYIVNFAGSCENGRLNSGAIYHLKIA